MIFRKILVLLLLLAAWGHICAQAFVHPGGLLTLADMNRMKTNVQAGNHPWIDDWNLLVADSEAQSNYTSHATSDFAANRQNADADAHAAYLNTIRWYVSGDVNFANTATNILNKWSSAVITNTEAGGGLTGLPTMSFALVGELLRTYSGWKPADFSAFTNMMVKHLYQPCSNFISSQIATFDHWTSWDSPSAAAIIGIGVLCDDTNKFSQAVNFFKSGQAGTGYGSGAISNAVPFLYGPLGQCMESGRDQEHCTLGIADLGVLCQVAWNQGIDLYGFAGNRLLAGLEYLAHYNLSHDVPYSYFYETADSSSGDNLFFVSNNGRGRIDDRPVYEMFYNHYVVLQGLSAPNVTAMAGLYRPEHGSADHFGYGTLTYTLNASASSYPPVPAPSAPTGLVAQPGILLVTLNWTASPGDWAQGYNVLRATMSGGPYMAIARWSANTFPTFIDTNVVAGTTYYYVVSAGNQSGRSVNSTEVSCTPVAAAALPAIWTRQDVGVATNTGTVQYSAAGTGTFNVSGTGTGIGGTGDGGFNYVFLLATNNATIVARLTGFSADQMGLMMRGSLATNSAEVQFFMADNARQSVFGYRNGTGANLNHYNYGDQFTYPPAWYRLTRTNNNFIAAQSADGMNWTNIANVTVNNGIPASGYYVGLAINDGTASFDNVFYTNAAMTGSFAPPSAPVGLTATALASNQVYLAWSAVTNAVGYNLRRSTVSGSGYSLIELNITAASFYDATVSPNTTYYYVVSAFNGGGESTNSIPATASTPAVSVPSAPAGLIATATTTQIMLNWNAVAGAASYNVKRSATGGGPYTNIATGVVANFSDSGVSPGQKYFYVVTATDIAGESANSSEANAWVGPSMQAYLKFDETGGNTAFDSTLNGWDGTLVNGATFVAGYSNSAVNLNSNNSQYVTLPAGVVSALTNFTISVWAKQTTSASWTRMFDFGMGTSTYMFLTPLPGGATAPRFAFKLNGGTELQINGTSAVSVGAWHHYAVTLNGSIGILYVDGVAVGTNSSLTLNPASLGSTSLNYIGKSQFSDPYFNGLVDEFRIYNDALKASEVATFVTPLSAPANLIATAGDGLITLKWNSVPRAGGYSLKYSLTNGGSYTIAAGTAVTNCTINGLVNGTTYYWVVSALNAVGESANSAQVSAQPVSTAPTTLALNVNGGQLQFNWAQDHTGWRLQAQTNSLGAGLGTNWVTVLNSSTTNQIVIPIGATNGNVFFRLTYP